MLLEKGIPKDLLKEAYWFRASTQNIYCVTLDYTYSKHDGDLLNVKAIASEIDYNYIDNDIDITKIKNGEKVMSFSLFDDWILELDIWGKYFFPKFNKEKNQWYHNCNDKNSQCLDDFNFILKETYNIAMKVSGLKTY